MKTWLTFTGIFLVYGVINVTIAEINNKIRIERIAHKDTRQINHPVWGAVYIALAAIPGLVFRNVFLSAAVLLQHAWLFPAIFNTICENPAFYLSKTTSALYDKTLVSLGFKTSLIPSLVMALISFSLLILAIL